MQKTRDKINAVQKALVDKHLFNMQEADSYATALFVEPFVWFLRSPNMQPYFKHIFERKLANLGYAESSIKELLAAYSTKKPATILQAVKEKNEFVRAHGIKTDALNKLVLYHCEKECYIYVPADKKADTEQPAERKKTNEELLLDKLRATMQGTTEDSANEHKAAQVVETVSTGLKNVFKPKTEKAAGDTPQDDETAQLRRLKQLFDEGLIDEEEFKLKKAKILGI